MLRHSMTRRSQPQLGARWARTAPNVPAHSAARPTVKLMAARSLAPFLLPEGFRRRGARAVLQGGERGGRERVAPRLARPRATGATGAPRRTPVGAPVRATEPVLLVPGFMAGDGTLSADGPHAAPPRLPHLPLPHPRQRRLHPQRRGAARAPARVDRDQARHAGCRSSATASAGCSPAASPYAVPTSSSGDRHDGQPDAGARGTTTRCCSPASTLLVRLSRAGVPDLMSEDCVAGACAAGRRTRSRGPRCCRRVDFTGDLLASATASSTGGRASTRWRRRSRSRHPPRDGRRPAGARLVVARPTGAAGRTA